TIAKHLLGNTIVASCLACCNCLESTDRWRRFLSISRNRFDGTTTDGIAAAFPSIAAIASVINDPQQSGDRLRRRHAGTLQRLRGVATGKLLRRWRDQVEQDLPRGLRRDRPEAEIVNRCPADF